MKITRTISSRYPHLCGIQVKNFFGILRGEVRYEMNTFIVYVKNEKTGSASDFNVACSLLLEDLGILETKCV